MMLLPALLVAAVLLLASAFLACSETALIAIHKIRLRHLVARGVPGAKTVQGLLTHLDQLLTAILISNNLINVALSAIGTVLCIVVWGPQVGVVVATVVYNTAMRTERLPRMP